MQYIQYRSLCVSTSFCDLCHYIKIGSIKRAHVKIFLPRRPHTKGENWLWHSRNCHRSSLIFCPTTFFCSHFLPLSLSPLCARAGSHELIISNPLSFISSRHFLPTSRGCWVVFCSFGSTVNSPYSERHLQRQNVHYMEKTDLRKSKESVSDKMFTT